MKTGKEVWPMDPAILGEFQTIRCEQICLDAGAHFLGIQKAEPEHGLEALCMFVDSHGSCMAVKMSEVSVMGYFELLPPELGGGDFAVPVSTRWDGGVLMNQFPLAVSSLEAIGFAHDEVFRIACL